MNEELRSVLLGLFPLYILAGISLVLTVTRHVTKQDQGLRNRLVQLFLVGVACQCIHFIEELLTGFYIHWPAFLGLSPWTSEFFVTFNLAWIAIWMVSAIGIQHEFSFAYFPVWFFILAMIGNAVFHPLLAIATGDYFPGLLTSPIVGSVGVLLASRLWTLTEFRQDLLKYI